MKICTDCQRHVKEEEQVCPFCSSDELRSEPARPKVPRGASRARIYAARAAIAGAALGTAAACGKDSREEETAQTSSGGNEGTGGSPVATGGVEGGVIDVSPGGSGAEGGADWGVPIYGGPFPDMVKARV